MWAAQGSAAPEAMRDLFYRFYPSYPFWLKKRICVKLAIEG